MPRNRNAFTLLKKYSVFYIMLIPVIVYFIVFSYYPVYLGIISSFCETKLMGGSVFIGLTNYEAVLKNSLYKEALINSLIVGVLSFLLQFGLGLLLALSINEVRLRFTKSAMQSVTYLPYLLSWAIVGSMWMKLLSPIGMVNGFLQLMHPENFKPIVFMSEAKYAREIMILTGGWKNAGYYAVLLLAAIVSIDPSIYEAAAIDGASRLRQIRSITVTNIVPTIKVITVLGTMGVLRNFDQIFVMENSNILGQIRNLLFQIYKDGVIKFQLGVATAAATLVLIATFIISAIIRKLLKYDETYE